MSTAVPLPDVRRALVVTAHPDDVERWAIAERCGVRDVTFLNHPRSVQVVDTR